MGFLLINLKKKSYSSMRKDKDTTITQSAALLTLRSKSI